MIQITEITSNAKQKLTFIGSNNEEIEFSLEYLPTQQGWNFSLSYLDFSVKGVRLMHSPNILRQWRNILPFGIFCEVVDGTDPYFLSDFTDERVIINLLDSDEVQDVEDLLYNE